MTFGEKISKLRKENNYTQEQLAEILGVSRQSVSKWESDIAYPETEKLIKMGKLFECSMDYLLNDDITDRRCESASSEAVPFIREILPSSIRKQLRERKSEKTVFGMPLYHIGRDARGFFAIGLKARGVFAVGLRAKGVVSLGLLSLGGISIGFLSVGLITFGTLALGLLSVGSVALGVFAAGAVSIGIVSFGALSVGGFSAGAFAVGKYVAVGDSARAMIAIGDTDAVGSVYGYIGSLSSADISYVRSWLDANVPAYLSWAKEIFKFYLC